MSWSRTWSTLRGYTESEVEQKVGIGRLNRCRATRTLPLIRLGVMF